MKRSAILAAAAVLGASGAASAVPLELFIDINTLTATWAGAGGQAFSLNATGTLTLADNATPSTLAGVRIDGVAQTVTSTLSSFSGTITLLNGVVTGGSFSTTNADATSYGASVRANSGSVSTQAGQGFSIDGLTFNGLFGSASYAGVNVSPWFNTQPDNGSFLNFAFNGNNTDNNVDVDLYVLVPMPAAAGLGLAGLAGLGIRRRR